MVAKRPAGFGKASKQKKVKQPSPEEEAELNVELEAEIDDEELAEVYGLYTKLHSERDPKIARGLVHECNELLRSRDEKNEVLPPKFHVVYGGALLTLADAESNKEHKEFRDAGVTRINVGLETNDIEAVAMAGFELIQYAHTQISSKTGELSGAGRKLLDYAINLLQKRESKQNPELARAAHRLLLIATELGDEDEAMKVARKILETQIKSNDELTKALGHKGLGQYYITLVAPAIDALEAAEEEDGDAKADPQLKSDLQSALSHLRQCVMETDQESHVMLAEALLQWAELVEDEEEEQKTYAEAVKHLKKARMLGNDGLNEIIESIENPE